MFPISLTATQAQSTIDPVRKVFFHEIVHFFVSELVFVNSSKIVLKGVFQQMLNFVLLQMTSAETYKDGVKVLLFR